MAAVTAQRSAREYADMSDEDFAKECLKPGFQTRMPCIEILTLCDKNKMLEILGRWPLQDQQSRELLEGALAVLDRATRIDALKDALMNSRYLCPHEGRQHARLPRINADSYLRQGLKMPETVKKAFEIEQRYLRALEGPYEAASQEYAALVRSYHTR